MKLSNLNLFTRKGNVGWLATIVVIFCAAFYAIAFTRIYTTDHSYIEASRWIFEHVPPGSSIAGVHWDDSVPNDLPNSRITRSAYKTDIELPLYEPETPERMKIVVERLAQSDFIALPTQRLQGSLLRIPEEYPHTASFFRQLFAGQLGFKLEKTIKARGSLLGYIFNDDLADESISVYDHPKVSIFKNTGRFTAQELERRIYNPPKTGTLPTLHQIMTTDAPGELPYTSKNFSVVVQVMLWFIVLEVLAWAIFPLIATALSKSSDRGFGIAKVFSILFPGLIVWQLSSYGVLELSSSNLWLIAGFLALVAHLVAHAFWGSWQELAGPAKRSIVAIEFLWYGLVIIFLVIRSFQPEITWGEKPMDFSFLNYFTRLNYTPPQDPWAAGQPMHYYYFGTLLFALLHKMTGVATGVGFNLAIVSLAAMIGVGAFSIFLRLRLSILAATLCSVALVFLSNLEVVRLLFLGDRIGFDLFWASTRLFTSPSFAEYPLWAMLFADLHAHVIALPFALAFIALSIELIGAVDERKKLSFPLLLLTGISIGALFLINSWDFIAYGGVLGMLLIFRLMRRSFAENDGSLPRALGEFVVTGLVVGMVAFAVIAPFLSVSGGKIEVHYGWVQSSEFNTLWQIFRHLGVWLMMIAAALPLLSGFGKVLTRSGLIQSIGIFVLISFPFFLGGATLYSGTNFLPWDILIFVALLMLCGGLCILSSNEEQPWFFQGVCMMSAAVILVTCELVFLNDRMNTIFKFYNPIWLLLAVAGLSMFATVGRLCLEAKGVRGRIESYGAAVIPVIVLLLSVTGSCIDIVAMTTFEREKKVVGPRPSLDGQAYLRENNNEEYQAIQWINSHVHGTPVMLEAQGDSYREFTRIVMHTGLPTVLGWEYHVSQRGTPWAELEERKRDVRNIYQTTNPKIAEELLRKYNVQLIVVGKIERDNYSVEGLSKFEDNPELFPLLFKVGDTSLYATSYSGLANLVVTP